MCVGIPMRIVECDGIVALCEGRNGTRTLDLSLVGEQPPGTWLLTFLDTAREVIDAVRAEQIDAALAGLEAALRGDTAMDAYFSDLIHREPALPAHLRGANE